MSFILLLITGLTYLKLQTTSIYGGDAGDLVAAAFVKGIPHPPGYPLYTAVGHILTRFSFSTPAFDVGLLSSIPSAFTVLFVFLIAKKLTKNKQASIIAALTLVFSYLFWLYSIVPEVFSLNLFFMSAILYLLLDLGEKPTKKRIYLLSLLLGLSLSHHHIILFFFPPVVYWLISIRKKIMPFITKKTAVLLVIFFLIGLLPYLYLPFAAANNPSINWNDPVTIPNFIKLITRADYGSFTAGGFVLNHPFARIYQFKAFARFIITEFTLIGVLIVILGCVYQFVNRRKQWNLLISGFIFVGPLFLFYAAYPLGADFGLATYERFLLPSYIYIAIWFAEGISAFSYIGKSVLEKLIPKTKLLPLTVLISTVFVVFPVSFCIAHYPKMKALTYDRTAEHLATDILSTAPHNAILILAGDTSLFDTQYVYYTENVRPDITLLQYSKLLKEYYTSDLNNHYPNLSVPPFGDDFITHFFRENRDTYTIYSSYAVPGSEGFWVRYGLLLKYYFKEEDIPSEEEIIKINKDLWDSYHNPLIGALSEYKHLMLFDIAKYYADSLLDFSENLFRVERYQESIPFLTKASMYQPYNAHIRYSLGKAYFENNECNKALDAQMKTIELDSHIIEAYEQLSSIYRVCFSDSQKSEFYLHLFEEKKTEEDIQLESL